MKKIYFFAVFFLLLFFISSCDKNNYLHNNNSCSVSPAGDTIRFSYHTVTPVFESCSDKLLATVTKIMDSRCPKDAVCVWAGTVSVILQMDNQFKITLELGKQKDTTYNSQNFSFTLMEVIPYPMAHPSVSVYDTTVLVRIIKQ